MPTIDDSRNLLVEARAHYTRLIAQIDAALAAIIPESESLPDATTVPSSAGITIRRKRNLSAAARKAVSERMKKYWAERRKSKAKR